MNGISEFVDIRGAKECPVCGHKDRCKTHHQHGDDLVVCFRSFDSERDYKRLTYNDTCAVFVRIGSSADRRESDNGRNGHPKPAPPTAPKFHDDDAARFAEQITDTQINELANELGVSADSLRRIGVGHDGRCPCFPERDGKGRVIGINRRREAGSNPRHQVRLGDRRGIGVPNDLGSIPGIVLAVEGGSDLAACLTMGIAAVGRPNNLSGAEFISELLPDREALIVGENDRKPDGTWPGQDGAIKVATALARRWGRPVRYALPPEGYKDVREYLNKRAAEDPIEVGMKLMAHFAANANVIKPVQSTQNILPDSRDLQGIATLDTDVGNAARMALTYAGRLRFCYGPNYWLVWDGRKWGPDNNGEVLRLAKKVVLAIFDEAKNADSDARREALSKHAVRSQKSERIAAMINLARPDLATNPSMLDSDLFALNCLNGTIALRTGELRPHDPRDGCTKLAPVEYDPSATCPLWDKILHRTFDGDQSLITFVQRWEGMSLTGDVRKQKMPIYHGKGGNGKNVHLDTICGIMGDYACEAPPNLLTATKHNEHPTEIADLMGRRFVVGSETEDSAQLRLQLVKRLTGNTKLKARFMRQDFFEFDRTFKLVLMTNNRPVVHEDGEAAWRRLRLVPFNVIIPPEERDPLLLEKLKDEWPGILAWLVRGCLDWQREGLTEPAAVIEATKDYRSESDHFGQWITECFNLGPENWTPSQRLRQEYERWCDERGMRKLTGNTFTNKLIDQHFRNDKKYGTRGWFGLEPKP